MPHFWKDNVGKEILVVSYDELVPNHFKTQESLRVVLCRSKKRGYGINCVRRGCNQRQALISYDSLPTSIKEAIADPRKELHVLEHFWETDKEAVRFFQDYRFDDGRSIKDRHQEKYIGTASILGSVIRLRDARIHEIISKGHVVKHLWQTLCDDVISFAPICKSKFETEFDLPENYRRFKEKVEDFEAQLKSSDKNNAYRWLIKEYHNTNNNQKKTKAMIELWENIFTQQHKPDYYEVYSIYNDFIYGKAEIHNKNTGECYVVSDEYKDVSYDTVKNYLSAWESKISTFDKRAGDRQRYIGQFKPAHKMDIDIPAGSLISIDDRQPPFKYDDNNRPWFYIGIDVGSECFTTWVWGKSKGGIILEFYRQMVRNYHEWGFNLPIELECEAHLNSDYRNTLLREGNMFDSVNILANYARGKFIERRFGHLRFGDEKERLGWIGRPFFKKEANQKNDEKIPLIPYDTIIKNSLKDIENWNNSPHRIYKDKTRWEVFCETQSPKTRPINWRGIIPYIGHKTPTSCKAGIVNLQYGTWLLADKGEYVFGEQLLNLMRLAEGEQLDVYWLDGNDGEVIKAFAYIGDEYICELLPQPIYKRSQADRSEQDMINYEIMSKYDTTIMSYGRRHKHEIEQVEVIRHNTFVLNNKFQIKELGNRPYMNGFLNHEQNQGEPYVETLPDPDEFKEDLIGIETPIKQTIYQRF